MAALILCAEPGDRSRLHIAARTFPLAEVGSVATIAAAEHVLASRDVDLLVVDLALPVEPLARLLERYRRAANGQVLAVLPRGAPRTAWTWASLPRSVVECVASPVDPAEAVYRLGRLVTAVAPAEARGHEPPFAARDAELVVTDPGAGRIREPSLALVAAAGGRPGDRMGRDLASLGRRAGDGARALGSSVPHAAGEAALRCRRPGDREAPREVSVRQRRGMPPGRPAQLARLPGGDRPQGPARALEALGSLFAGPESEQAEHFGRLVSDILGLDFLVIGMREGEEGVRPVLAHGRGGRGHALTDPMRHRPCARLLAGESIFVPENAGTVLADDPFVTARGIEAYVGLPVPGGPGEVAGVLVGAARAPLAEAATVRATLEVLAGRQGLLQHVRRLGELTTTQGLHDGLTGLPNRLLFHDRLKLALHEARRSGEMVALMFVDLDRFKTINDRLGHGAADRVLAAVAARLRRSVRSSDTVARYAGDQFTILLRHIVHRDDMLRVAQKINRLLAEPLPVDGADELHLTASIGVSFFPDDGASGEELLRHADAAMHDAKGMGRNTYQSYVEQADEGRQQKLVLEARLRAAEANGELRVFYQPQVASDSENLVGMEALIRWEHPELGLISPGFFVPLAEETGLIVPMGEWLLRRAVADAKAWQDRFRLPLVLGVNLSPLQLRQPDLVAVVERALNEVGMDPRRLDLEVTESISIKTIPGLRERLGELRDLGCTISIDDFGTGQSSLDYLKRFPVDRIKIDQSFVRNIGVDPDDEAIVRATISMAHSLKLRVIAEGVEEEDQLAFLRHNGCEECQGYLFCRPLPADSFARLLIEREALTTRRPATGPI